MSIMLRFVILIPLIMVKASCNQICVCFFHSVYSFQTSLEDYKLELQNMTQNIEKEVVNLKEQIEELKAHLYAKFGSNIHLENDED